MSSNYNITAAQGKLKIYTEHEFLQLKKSGNRQEILLAAVLDNREELLSNQDLRYLELLKRAFNILTDNPSPVIARRKIGKLLDVPKQGRILQIIRDVNHIFCNVEERNREMDRMVMENKIAKLIEKIERRDPDSKNLPPLYKLLAQIKGVLHNEQQALPWDEWELPIPVYTNDPNALLNKTVDGEYEEAETETD